MVMMEHEEIKVVLQCILFFEDGLSKEEVCMFGFNCHVVNSAFHYWESLKLAQIPKGEIKYG